ATVCMHVAPTASRRVYQQRIGRIMRTHARKEAGVVVDFVPKAATHNERVISLHSLLDADFYREGARVTPAPRRRVQRRARRKLTPAPWLVPVTPDVRRRLAVITREWQRVDPKYLDEDEQRYWATIAGRQIRFDERAAFVEKLTARGASRACLEQFLATCAAENPNRRLRIIALSDRVSMTVERADFDDLVTLVTQAPAENLPQPKLTSGRSRRRKRRKRKKSQTAQQAGPGQQQGQEQEQQAEPAQARAEQPKEAVAASKRRKPKPAAPKAEPAETPA